MPATIVTRTGKGSPLTIAELDANLTNLNNVKYEDTDTRATIRPSLLLAFDKMKKLDPRITFTRSSAAKCYDGKTTVKAEENLLVYSQNYTQSNWAKPSATITPTATTAPDGTNTASKMVETATTAEHYLVQTVTASANAHTFSIYAKAAERTWMAMYESLSTTPTYFDLVNGIVGTVASGVTASISYAGNGWYRCSITRTLTAAAYSITIDLVLGDGLAVTYAGDNTKGIYIWGAQLEQRAYATAYTPTTTAAVTNYIPALQSYAANVARFDFNPVTGESLGLMVEEQRANLVPYSQQFDASVWTKNYGAIFANAAIAPDGSLTAAFLREDATNNGHYLAQLISVSNSTAYAYSVYLKAGSRTRALLYNTSSAGGAVFDLSAGTVVGSVGTAPTSSTITPVGNNWYRCSVVFTTAGTSAGLQIYTVSTGSTFSYTGDGYSGLYVWGAQLEAGAFATSYIPTLLTYSGRGSVGTYIGDNGLIQTAAANVARYQRNVAGAVQLLLEGAATNLLQWTQQLDNAAWSKGGVGGGFAPVVTANQAIAPDGTMTADLVVFVAPTSGNRSIISQSVTTTAASVYTGSLWVKAYSSGDVGKVLLLRHVSGSAYTSITLTASWQRVSSTETSANSAFYLELRPDSGSSSGTVSCYLWGAQLEIGSVATSYIPSTESFTSRSGTATYFDPSGVMRTAPSGLARYDFDPVTGLSKGLLLEGAGQNLISYSQDMSGWTVTNGTITGNAATAPDGTTTANQFVSAAGAAAHFFQRNITTTAVVHTVSIFAKYDSVQYLYLDAYITAAPAAVFDLQNGTLVSTTGIAATIQAIGSGWYRCSMAFTAEAGTTQIRVFPTTSSSGTSYNGDGVHGVFAWGAQLETGSVATSYIPTTSTQVTRAADTATSVANSRAADVWASAQATRSAENASMPVTGWLRNDEGTLYAEAFKQNPDISSTNWHIATISSGNSNNYFKLRVEGATGKSASVVYNNSVQQFNGLSGLAIGAGTPIKMTVAFKLNDIALTNSGIAPYTGTSLIQPINLNIMNIGSSENSTQFLNGCIRRIAYYPVRLNNTTLQNLTV